MAVREADGDARSYFREGYEEQAKLPQVPFEAMPDWRLQKVIDEGKRWAGDNVPDGFDPWNSWGGEYTARKMAQSNADQARLELERRKPTTASTGRYELKASELNTSPLTNTEDNG